MMSHLSPDHQGHTALCFLMTRRCTMGRRWTWRCRQKEVRGAPLYFFLCKNLFCNLFGRRNITKGCWKVELGSEKKPHSSASLGSGCQLDPLNHLLASLHGEITLFSCKKKYVAPVLIFIFKPQLKDYTVPPLYLSEYSKVLKKLGPLTLQWLVTLTVGLGTE